MRHRNISNVSTRAVDHPDVFETIGKLSKDKIFESKMVEAMENPEGQEAKTVMNTFEKLIRVIGSKTPFSSSERESALSHLIAMMQYFGPASVFFTLALDDSHTILSLRMSYPSKSGNKCFPAKDDGFAE